MVAAEVVAVRAGSAAAHAAVNAADADADAHFDDSGVGLIQGGDDIGRTGGRASSTAHKEGAAAVDTSDSAGAVCAADAGAADAGSDNDNDDGASCSVIQSDFSFSFLSRRR